jgi:hypothetical protein
MVYTASTSWCHLSFFNLLDVYMKLEMLLCGRDGTVLLGFNNEKLFVSPSVTHTTSPGLEKSYSAVEYCKTG